MTTFAAAVASRLPKGLVGSAAVALYPRFEPELRRLADRGETDAIDQLVQLGAELGDMALLRSLADAGSADAADQLIELATESDDLDELRRLADKGNITAAEVLAELAAE